MTRWFDTHAHYTDEVFDADRAALLEEMGAMGGKILIPGCNPESSRLAVAIAETYAPFVYAAVGVHPHDASGFLPGDVPALAALAEHPKVKAIGEAGLDYHYEHCPRDVQKRVLHEQFELAVALDLPLIMHDREAHADSLGMVKEYPQARGVFHCFSGSVEMAREIIAHGWYLSFTGMVTFPKTRRALEVAAQIPLERLLLETDAPYMSPVPHRGRRCDSRYLPLTAAAIARARGMDTEEVLAKTYQNACAFLRVDDQ